MFGIMSKFDLSIFTFYRVKISIIAKKVQTAIIVLFIQTRNTLHSQLTRVLDIYIQQTGFAV